VKERLVQSLKDNLKLANVRVVSEIPKDTNVDTLKGLFDTGVVLDVQTRKWGIDNNRAKYSALVRLVRLSDTAVLWEAACNEAVADKEKPAPARDALVADDGALLKAKLVQAADQCASELAGWLTLRPG
jgi:predicted dinucleotide-utilizing enzyme